MRTEMVEFIRGEVLKKLFILSIVGFFLFLVFHGPKIIQRL
jgi:hypothetical protein